MNRTSLLASVAAVTLAIALFLHLKTNTSVPSSPVASATLPQLAPSTQSPPASIPASAESSADSPLVSQPPSAPSPQVAPAPPARIPPPRAIPPTPERVDLGPVVRNPSPAPRPVPQPDERVIPRHIARAALSFVGADEDAEEIWAAAINDPAMPPDVRKDLIEDLNEDGFPDPKNITEDDLPLILSRLELIEAIAPDSMDEINYEAFRESYKDLTNMLAKLNR